METQGLNLLVVEDDIQDFVLLRALLQASQRVNCQIMHAKNFEDAAQLLLDESYDLVLLDYFLGSYTGVDLLKHAKIVGLDTPIIVLTGGSTPEMDDALMQLGASDFIPKDELTTGLLERSIRHAVERKRIERHIAQMLKKDPLTGLGNRLIFEEHTELAIARAIRNKTNLAVIFMDLDRFKEVNDALGHHVGDLLLTVIGHRLLSSVRKSDVVARIGGDEFTLLLDNVKDEIAVAKIAQKILNVVMQPAQLGTTLLNVSASMGIAMYPEHGEDGISLMQKADMALYECKKNPTEHYAFFTNELQLKLKNTLALEQSIRQGIENKEFELYYQPQVNLLTGELAGFEALIRWPQADGSMRMPDYFIPEANHMGLILPLGEWVIEEACQQLKVWSKYRKNICLSINVSPRQLKTESFKSYLLDAVKRYEIEPGRFEIELTEDAFIETGVANASLLHEIRSAGVRIAIDDFGTGYSSMRYLKAMPLNRIKIDRSFISGSDVATLSDPTITQAILFLAKGLSLDVVAEGVETQEQLDALAELGCQVGQGYFFYRPMTKQSVDALFFDVPLVSEFKRTDKCKS